MSRRRRHGQRTQEHAPAPAAESAAPKERLRPWLLGVAAMLLVARPLFPSESPAATGDGLPVVMLWIALAVVWMLGVIGRRRFAVRFGWLDAAVVALVAWHTVAALVGAGHGSPRPAVNMLWEWVGLGLVFLLARQFIAGRREARAVTAVMLGLAVALSAYGLHQGVYEMPQTRDEYRHDPDGALRRAGMWYAPGSPQRAAFEKRLESVEPLATFALTNSLAGVLAPWLVVAAAIALSVRPRSTPATVWIGLGCAGVVIAACLILTKSRSAYLAVAAGLAALGAGWLRGRMGGASAGGPARRARLAVGASALVVIALLAAGAAALGGLDVQVLTEASKSLGYRVQYWEATRRMIADGPLFGCGPGNFQEVYTRYKLPEASEEIADPHNFLLEIWATAGTPAAAAMLAVLGIFALTVVKRRSAGKGDESNLCEAPSGPLRGKLDSSPFPAESDELATPDGLQRADQPHYALAGGACGFLLAALLGAISTAPPGLAPIVLGLPLAALTVALLYPWIDRGRMSAAAPALGAGVLLVNLLAAGGISFAGVAYSLWLLMALAVDAARPCQGRALPWSAAVAGLVVSIALAVACHTTAYSPVLQAQAAMRQAERQPLRAEALLLTAAQDDPLAAEPWERLASLAYGHWEKSPNPENPALGRFEKYTQTALEKAPNSATAWFVAGDRWLAIGDRLLASFQAGGRREYLVQALTAFGQGEQALQQAVALYPNNPLYRARLAEVFVALQYRPGFEREAREALRLDELTPHADKKLPDELRKRLSRMLESQ